MSYTIKPNTFQSVTLDTHGGKFIKYTMHVIQIKIMK